VVQRALLALVEEVDTDRAHPGGGHDRALDASNERLPKTSPTVHATCSEVATIDA
jgi:hypothetical protein